jgi:4'-phosphopantetheinyl transferase
VSGSSRQSSELIDQPNRSPAADDAVCRHAPIGRIDLWHGSLKCRDWRDLIVLLSDQERCRANGFIFDRDARRYIVSHAVLRSLLSRFTGIAACKLELRFRIGLKPALATRIGQPIHFSLSRSEERVLIGFAPRPLGADLEWLGKMIDCESLLGSVLSPREQEAFKRIDPRYRKAAFLRCWTQKEAYLKAVGTGLALSPAGVEVFFGPGKLGRLESRFGEAEATEHWLIDVVAVRPDYVGAVAISGGPWRKVITAFDTSSLLANR